MPVLIDKQKPLTTEEAATPVAGTIESPEANQDKGFFVSRRKVDFGQNSSKSMTIAAIVAVLAIGGVFAMSHREGPGTKRPQVTAAAAPVKPVAQPNAAYKPGDRAAETPDGRRDQAVSPSDIENTKNTNPDADSSIANPKHQLGPAPPKYAASQSVRQNLGAVPPFQAPTYTYGASAVPPIPSINTAAATEQARQYQDAVTKPSYVFAAQPASGGAGGDSASESITNFGLAPGFHLPAHLESSVSTLGGVPAVAIIEYNYVRGGRVVIPAGSRVIGKIGGASSTGLVQIAFTEIYLPNGTTIPISAVALDSSLHPLKGIVTGKNTGKQIILGALSSAGSLGAGFLNSSNTVTQTDLARNQIAGNIGRSGDQAIQQLQVGQSIVVTVPSGVLVYVTFVAPVRGGLADPSRGTAHIVAAKN
jgi:type IV secretory pathway VirB10-like protein